MRKDQDSAVEALVEQLIEGGSENMAESSPAFSLAMRIERIARYANGTRPKKISKPMTGDSSKRTALARLVYKGCRA